MPLIDTEQPPSPSMQRWFGLSLAVAICILGWMLRPLWAVAPIVSVGVGGAVAAVYYLLPKSRLVIIRGWQKVTFPVAWMLSHLLLGSVFLLIVTPLGYWLRWRGHDPLQIRPGRRTSAWSDHRRRDALQDYFRQF
ncbi:MAG: hypothetical protein KatS3mg111_2616 [Pirellulaceae bacterium]|nr:MAG: hypothetical protein KatS3mg111_2616 [Pirellulaceae bacterium]